MIEMIDLSKLPPPQFVEERNPLQIRNELISDVEKKMGDGFKLLESDPMYRLIEVFAYRESQLLQRVNYEARQVFLSFSSGNNLEHLASFFNVKRENKEETDQRLQEKVHLSLEEASTCGSAYSYKAHVLKHGGPDLVDAKAGAAKDKEIDIVLLFRKDFYFESLDKEKKGKTKKEDLDLKRKDLINKITKILLSEELRPINDHIKIWDSTFKYFYIKAQIEIKSGLEDTLVKNEIKKRLSELFSSSYAISKKIVKSSIIAALHAEGVISVDLQLSDNENFSTKLEKIEPLFNEVLFPQFDFDRDLKFSNL